MAARASTPVAGRLKYADVMFALLLVLVVVMMVIPLPTFLVDLLLAANIAFSATVLLVTFYVGRALEISSFPTILLFATLFRLGLNVSTTRLILLQGYAGKVISAFGQYVVGGNYVVGAIIFLILVIIQFVVITRGAERVAEVAARFTLDAMPGKQMAIDADLNAGLIDEAEARRRRAEVQREADFYGAMDGASKFVKGDAVAGLIITAVNILGGLAVGVFQRGLTLSQALSTYAILTVGDGLSSQIPALLLSTSAGIIVTRAAGEHNLGADVASQLTSYPRPLYLASFLLLGFSMVPGFPSLSFLLLSALMGFLAYRVQREGKEIAAKEARPPEEKPKPKEHKPEDVMPLLQVDPMEVEIGYGLIPLVDPAQGGDMLERIGMIRKQMALELGLVVPPIRIRDNIQLRPSEYVVKVRGAEVGRGELMVEHYLAINPGTAEGELVGIPTKDPAFGIPALWIPPELRDRAESLGYTVVDAPSVLATHLSEVIKRHGHELLSRQEVQKLVDAVKESSPALASDLMGVLSLSEVQKVLQNLVKEGVPIRDLTTIFEVLSDWGRAVRNVDLLTEKVREALSRHITRRFASEDGVLYVLTLSPEVERSLQEKVRQDQSGALVFDVSPREVQELVSKVSRASEAATAQGRVPLLLVHPGVRLFVRRALEAYLPGLPVLSYAEVLPGTEVKVLGVVS